MGQIVTNHCSLERDKVKNFVSFVKHRTPRIAKCKITQNGVSMTCIDNCIMEKDKVVLLKHMTLYHNDQIIITQNSVIMTCIDKLCMGKATLECDSGSVTIRFVCLIYLFICHHKGSPQTESEENFGFWTFTFPICKLVFCFFPDLGRVLE